jgi:hypothetical protein
MSMTVLVVGLNAPSCPSLPLFTCARPPAGNPATSTVTQKMIEESFTPPARRRIASLFISKLLSRKPSGFHGHGFTLLPQNKQHPFSPPNNRQLRASTPASPK